MSHTTAEDYEEDTNLNVNLLVTLTIPARRGLTQESDVMLYNTGYVRLWRRKQ